MCFQFEKSLLTMPIIFIPIKVLLHTYIKKNTVSIDFEMILEICMMYYVHCL